MRIAESNREIRKIHEMLFKQNFCGYKTNFREFRVFPGSPNLCASVSFLNCLRQNAMGRFHAVVKSIRIMGYAKAGERICPKNSRLVGGQIPAKTSCRASQYKAFPLPSVPFVPSVLFNALFTLYGKNALNSSQPRGLRATNPQNQIERTEVKILRFQYFYSPFLR
jgi:hypothetical protein